MRLLSVASSIFGPQKLVREVFIQNREHLSCQLSYDGNQESESGQFMQIFTDIFVPWCLQKNICSTNARLDLLLALLDDEYFPEQWCFIVNYATSRKYSECPSGLLDAESAAILAMLLEKARVEITKRKVKEDSSNTQATNADLWHHDRLESAVIAVSHSPPPFSTAHVQFVWYVISNLSKAYLSIILC